MISSLDSIVLPSIAYFKRFFRYIDYFSQTSVADLRNRAILATISVEVADENCRNLLRILDA